MSTFIISLDFELIWGVRDSRGAEYHEQLLNVYKVVPQMLSLFEKYGAACTWATVGALCVSSKEEFEELKPALIPSYDNDAFNPYNHLNDMFKLEKSLIFANNLVEQIVHTPNQEVASHTFCHYYCLESGQSVEQFSMDLDSNVKAAEKFNINLKSLVFPRNQFNQDYLAACSKFGFTCYRGNPEHWAYKAESREGRSIIRRAFRLLDAYIPLSGSLRQKPIVDCASGMVNIPASLFLRPASSKLSFLESIRLWRIKWGMTQTAKKGGIFHLWWHPHNFGCNTLENLTFLEEILKHYKYLYEQYDFESLTMEQVALQVKSE